MIRTALIAIILALGGIGIANNSSRAEDLFDNRIAPLLERRCLSCHNDSQHEGDFSLQSSQTAMADGYIVPGDIEGSHLLQLITSENGRAEMPKDSDPLVSMTCERSRKSASNSRSRRMVCSSAC